MYTRKHWNILIVDDDPGVHAVTELVLKRVTIYGAPIKLVHAHSAREARTFLAENEDLTLDIAVALVDVVMENDDAGLQLIRYIREDLRISSMQLILRTGQPGLAPPREVIDGYTISTYMSKAEATPERLYVAIKSGILQFYNQRFATCFSYALEIIRELSPSKEHVMRICQAVFKKINHDWRSWAVLNMAVELGDQYAGVGYFSERIKYEAIREAWYRRDDKTDTFMAWSGLDNPWMVEDAFVVTQTKIPGTKVTGFLTFYDPTMPDGFEHYYGPLLRMFLQALGQMVL